MLPGIFAKTFARPTVEEVFAAVAKHHLRNVQFNFSCAGLPSLPEEIDLQAANRIRKAAAAHRIEIAAVSSTFNMIHPDAKLRREGLHRLGVIAAASERIGTNLVTLCTGTRDTQDMWRGHADNDSPQAWRDLHVTLTKALTLADKHNLTLCIEPEAGNVISSARHARRLLDEMKSPRLKIIMDPANLFQPGDLPRMNEILEEAFDLVGADIGLAHAKELGVDGHASSLPLGAGVMDWECYLALLKAAKFDGSIIMHGFEERNAAASAKFLRDQLDTSYRR